MTHITLSSHDLDVRIYAAMRSRMQLLLLANVGACGLWTNLKLKLR